jgi:hypothetical protein
MARKRRRKKARDPLCIAFDLVEEEFGDHRSTEFLVQIVVDRLGVTPESVFDSLLGEADRAA